MALARLTGQLDLQCTWQLDCVVHKLKLQETELCVLIPMPYKTTSPANVSVRGDGASYIVDARIRKGTELSMPTEQYGSTQHARV